MPFLGPVEPQVMIGEDTLLRFSGCKAGEACTIVLRGARWGFGGPVFGRLAFFCLFILTPALVRVAATCACGLLFVSEGVLFERAGYLGCLENNGRYRVSSPLRKSAIYWPNPLQSVRRPDIQRGCSALSVVAFQPPRPRPRGRERSALEKYTFRWSKALARVRRAALCSVIIGVSQLSRQLHEKTTALRQPQEPAATEASRPIEDTNVATRAWAIDR